MGGWIPGATSQKTSQLTGPHIMEKEIAGTNETPDGGRWSDISPALKWLREYQPGWIRLDVAAGITLAAYLLPAGLADASLANLPPEAGLYACLFGGLVFWLFCSSRHTVVSTTTAISVLTGASLGEIAGGGAWQGAAASAGCRGSSRPRPGSRWTAERRRLGPARG